MAKWRWSRERQLLIFVCIFCFRSGLIWAQPQSCSEEKSNSLRLTATNSIQSPDGNVGRLEVCKDSFWSSFKLDSDKDFWPMKNVQVACRQLGFSGGLNSIPPSHIPIEDKSPRDLYSLSGSIQCSGEEDILITGCEENLMFDSIEAHYNDVFIVCRPRGVDYSDLHIGGEQIGDIRLFGHTSNGIGAVQIRTSELGWTGICPDSWTNADARVICQALGYDFGIAENFPTDNFPVNRSVHDASCSLRTPNTDPSRIQAKMCSFQIISESEPCPVSLYAGVSCRNSKTSTERPIRFFGQGLFDEQRAVGVLEVFMDNRWGLVCDKYSEEQAQINAIVLCKEFFIQVKDSKAVRLPSSSLKMHESSLKPLWANGLTCPSEESAIDDCIFAEPLGFSNCSEHILAIDCGSTVVPREGNRTAIIVGTIVVIFIFALVLFTFGTIFYATCKKRRAATSSASHGINGINGINEINGSNGAALDDLYYSETKLFDDVGAGKGKVPADGGDSQTTVKLT